MKKRKEKISHDEEETEEEEIEDEELYIQKYVSTNDKNLTGNYIRPISGNKPTGFIGSRRFNLQDNKRWQIHKIYKTQFNNIPEQKRNTLVDYANSLNLDHKNLFFIALALVIAYDIRGNEQKLSNQTFDTHVDHYRDIIKKDISSSKSINHHLIYERYKISIYSYLIFIIDNIKIFENIKNQ